MKTNLTPETLLARNNAILASSIDDELVMFDAEAGKYYGMNSVATEIWEHLESPASVHDICKYLTEQFDISIEKCEEELLSFLPELVQKQILRIEKQ